MGDNETTLAQLREAIRKFRDERDWEKYHTPKDLAVSISIEASELLELFQWKDRHQIEDMLEDPVYVARIKGEVADVLNYCLAMANTLDMDVSETMLAKVRDNSEKYPVEKTKGNYRKYTEL